MPNDQSDGEKKNEKNIYSQWGASNPSDKGAPDRILSEIVLVYIANAPPGTAKNGSVI